MPWTSHGRLGWLWLLGAVSCSGGSHPQSTGTAGGAGTIAGAGICGAGTIGARITIAGGFGAAVVDGRIYLPGGASRQGGGAVDTATVYYFP